MSDHRDSLYDSGGRWRRLELESFDTPAEAPAAADTPAEAAPALPDPAEVLAEIERLREAARARGHAEGYADGHTQGYEAGFTEGREAGYQAGHAAGLTDGHAEGLETARQEAQKIHELAEACARAVGTLEEETGEALVNLAVSIARQVIRHAVKTEPERILDVIRDVLQVDGTQQGILKLRLNPADVEMVQQFLQKDGTVAHWRLQADMSIDRGGCIAETALGNIDATLQTRWQRVISTLGAQG